MVRQPKLPCTIMEYIVVVLIGGMFIAIPCFMLSCLALLGYGVYYFVNCPAVQTWLGY